MWNVHLMWNYISSKRDLHFKIKYSNRNIIKKYKSKIEFTKKLISSIRYRSVTKNVNFFKFCITYVQVVIYCIKLYFFSFDKVKVINWCLNVQSSSSAISKDAQAVVLLQLGLTGDKTSTLTTEFNKKQLTDLYYNLEKIQTQLDALK